MNADTVKTNVERIIFQTIHVFLAPKTLQLLHSYVSERVFVGKTCSLENILDFVNKAESTVEECVFMGSSTLPRNLTFLDQVQCSESSALNLSSIQSNLTLLSSNAANFYIRGGKSQFGAKESRDLRMKGKIRTKKKISTKPMTKRKRGTKIMTKITVRIQIIAHIETMASNMSLSLSILR